MMCDRDPTVTYIPKTQPGFIGFATLPLLQCIAEVLPNARFLTENLLQNKKKWEDHPEELNPKEVYTSQSKGKLALTEKLWV